MGYKLYRTPRDFFDELNEEFHFTIDMAADQYDHLLPRYKTVEDDGRKVEHWCGERVFCNPPYTGLINWVKPALSGEAELAVLLLPPSFDTAWFGKIWRDGAALTDTKGKWLITSWLNGRELRVYNDRISFYKPDPNDPSKSVLDPNPRAGNLVAVFR